MKIRINCDKIRDYLEAVKGLVNEGNLNIGKEALEIVAMDPANCAMVIFRLDGTSCLEYEVEKEEKIGINFSNLHKIVKRFKDESVILELENNLLQISSSAKEFTLPVIELEGDQKIPELAFDVSFDVKCKELNEALLDADIVAESAKFVIKDNAFRVEAQGDLSSANTLIPTTLLARDKQITARFSLEYLNKIVITKLTENVKIELKSDYPLRLTYTDNSIVLQYILAPRISEDDREEPKAGEEEEEAEAPPLLDAEGKEDNL